MSDNNSAQTSIAEDMSEQAGCLSLTAEIASQTSVEFTEADQRCFVLGYN